MDIYYNNLNYLKRKTPLLYETIKYEKENIGIKILKNLENNCLVQTDEAKCFINSIYSNENEMKMMFEKLNEEVSTIVIFGIGNGESIKYINKNFKKIREIVVIEPSLELFKFFLKKNDIKEYLNPKINLTLVVNKEVDFSIDTVCLKLTESINNAIVSHVSYCSLFNKYRCKMMEGLKKKLVQRRNDYNVLSSQWKLWTLNTIMNLKNKDACYTRQVSNTFREKIIVFVAAGPSLEKNYMWLNSIKEKAIVIAVGTGISRLDCKAIKPHFRGAIDALPKEKKAIETKRTDDVPIIFSNQLYYEILKEYKAEKIGIILESDILTKYIYDMVGINYDEYLSGSSVINSMLNLVCESGCKQVIFMGQDLAYKGYEIDNKSSKTKYIETKDINGNVVFTTDYFMSMKYSIESTIRKYKAIDFFNATEGGINIEGAINITAEEAVKNNLKNEDIVKNVSIIFSDKEKESYRKKIDIGLNSFCEELEVVDKYKNDINEILKEINLVSGGLKNIKKRIKDIERIMKDMEESLVYKGFIRKALNVNIKSIDIINDYKYEKNEMEIIKIKTKIIKSKMALLDDLIVLIKMLIKDDIKIHIQ